MAADAMSLRGIALGRLWPAESGYRLAWDSRSCGLHLVGLPVTLPAQGFVGSPQRAAELDILRDRAGRDGDVGAFRDLVAAAEAGEIDAATRLATLCDPLLAGGFPRKRLPNDIAAALRLYRPGSEVGDPLATARLADLLLEDSHPGSDRQRGGRLARAWLDHPATTRETIRTEPRLAEKLARCLVDPESGLEPDPDRAGALVVELLRLGYDPVVHRYVRDLGSQPPVMIRALQRVMAARKVCPYTGPVDGLVHSETVEALEREAGLRSFLGVQVPEPGPGTATPPVAGLSDEAFRNLAQEAKQDAGALARIQAIAETGNAAALATLGYLYSPSLNKGAVFAPDARRAAANFERAAAAGDRQAGTQAAGLHDKGLGNLEKDPARAAALMLRQFDIDPGYELIVTDPEIGASWSPAFWGALQRELATRGLYTNPIENRRNDAVITAIRQLTSARGAARIPSKR